MLNSQTEQARWAAVRFAEESNRLENAPPMSSEHQQIVELAVLGMLSMREAVEAVRMTFVGVSVELADEYHAA